MRQVNIRIGPLVFDHADYDAGNDVLYLHIGEPQEAEGEETPERAVLRSRMVLALGSHGRCILARDAYSQGDLRCRLRFRPCR